ncbi:Adenosylmethionine-8-amino-7-oxononanoate aminotransferase [Moraxella catarrhalis]|nr:Adenosylmethionine-8-amino-7-oxononanoate aminotransferase [Moraxella catarrhalis]
MPPFIISDDELTTLLHEFTDLICTTLSPNFKKQSMGSDKRR